MNVNESIRNFKSAMKHLDETDKEVVSRNLHKKNMRIERDIQFAMLNSIQLNKRSYTSMRIS